MRNSIGGYFELECSDNAAYHKDALLLNSGRNALRYIVRAYGLKDILVPSYTCPVIFEALAAENCSISYYSLDEKLFPKLTKEQQKKDTFILYTNYFGVSGNHVEELIKYFPNLIVDNAQAFFAVKKGIASFYSPRKFFGLPDGGMLISNKYLQGKMDQDHSYGRCAHLLKRHDLSANEGYSDFQSNDASLENLPVKYMSRLTKALMGNVNYEQIKKRRLDNFSFLQDKLEKQNELKINANAADVPMVYPLLISNNGLRKKLIENKIFVATYWPGIEKSLQDNSFDLHLQKYLVPLPIDQRYTIDDMKFILKVYETN